MPFPGGRERDQPGPLGRGRPGAGLSPAPPAGALTLGQAEYDRGIEGVSGPQGVHHPGWREGIRVEQPSIRAQGISALLSPGADKHSPARPSTQWGCQPTLGPQPHPPPQGSAAPSPRPDSRPKASSGLPPTHPFLTRPYKPLRASPADRNPKCLATSLLTNTCGQWKRG